MRSLSFTRSSPASRNSVTPSANAAATARTGISSITHGIVGTLDRGAVQRGGADAQLPDRLAEPLAGRHHLDRRAHAHAARRRSAMRAGLSATSSTTSSEPGRDGGRDHPERGRRRIAGHVEARTAAGAPAVTRTARSSTRVIGAPSAASIRSVWSRLGAGSAISVVPSACSPARTSAVFTCALAHREQVRGADAAPPPRTTSGGSVPSARPSSCAPIAAQRLDDPAPSVAAAATSSPVEHAEERVARRAGRRSRRMVVPELPQSTTPVGSVNAVDARGRRR